VSVKSSIFVAMKQFLFLLLFLLSVSAGAQDTRCMRFLGIPLEGPVDSVTSKLHRQGFTDWGTSSDETEQHFRGSYYGIRCKLIVSCDPTTRFVTSAYITVGPYGSKTLFNRNFIYYKNKLIEEYGEMSERNGAWYYVGDYGIVKLSDNVNETGAQEIKVFIFCTAPYYKDVQNFGLHGNVMEVVTDNPVMENPVEQFDRTGRTQQTDLIERRYDEYGYLMEAKMQEQQGEPSLLTYSYDSQFRLRRRVLVNKESGLRSVNEYTYNDDDELVTQSQKVFDKQSSCILSILLKYAYDEDNYDDNGNWTSATVELVYWEKNTGTQTSTLTQTRKISYWEDE